MEGTSSNLDVFAATLIEAAKADRSILVVTSDSRGSGRLAPFAAAVPEQIVEVGIAEQNLVGISAGLTAAGKKVFAVSPACFLTARALEQIKTMFAILIARSRSSESVLESVTEHSAALTTPFTILPHCGQFII